MRWTFREKASNYYQDLHGYSFAELNFSCIKSGETVAMWHHWITVKRLFQTFSVIHLDLWCKLIGIQAARTVHRLQGSRGLPLKNECILDWSFHNHLWMSVWLFTSRFALLWHEDASRCGVNATLQTQIFSCHEIFETGFPPERSEDSLCYHI